MNRHRWILGTTVVLLLIGIAILLPKPAVNLELAFAPLSWKYPLGTTPLGQSVISEVLAGAGQTVTLAVGALAITLLLSLFVTGLLYLTPAPGGRAYALLVDAWLAIPGIFIALSVGYFLPQGFLSVLAALVLSEFAAIQKFFLQRLSDIRKSDYISMARVMGADSRHTFHTHVWPRLRREAGYLFFLTLPSMVLSLAGLEFLGVQTGSERLSLGMQIAVYKDYILLYPHLSLAPVLCLLATLGLLHWLHKRFS